MGKGRFFETSGETGHLLESRMLGESTEKETGYQYYKEAINFVKEHQAWENPSDPDPRFANDLHATIADKLGIEDYDLLKFYTAVGSALDHYHGIDAFFELEINPDNPHEIIRVTIDITKNQEKGEYKADVIITIPPNGLNHRKDRAQWLNFIDKTAEEILARFEDMKKLKLTETIAA